MEAHHEISMLLQRVGIAPCLFPDHGARLWLGQRDLDERKLTGSLTRNEEELVASITRLHGDLVAMKKGGLL